MIPALIVALIVAELVTPAAAQLLVEQAKRDEVIVVDEGMPEMATAIAKARATLPDFLRLADRPRNFTRNFAVKVGVPTDRGPEYLWFALARQNGAQISGQLLNTPRWTTAIAAGDLYSFDLKDIIDWVYIDRDRMKGNFTSCAISKMASVVEGDALRKYHGLTCDN